jgi:outer membrane protein assembly factor BamD
VAAAAAALVVSGCAARQLDLQALSSASDKIVWDAAQKAIAKKDWESTRQYLRRIVEAFPQSEYLPEARLALGDSYMQEGGTANYVLAVAEFREFLTLYPSHPKADVAQYQAGEAYFRQRNSPDRDQTATLQALDEYQRLLDAYPNSALVEPTRERIGECRQTLARSDHGVGYFYQRTRQAWRAAIGRYERVLSEYPDYERTDEVLYRLGECLAAVGRFPEALPVLSRLLSEFPQSAYVEDARKLMANLPVAPPPGAGGGTPPAGPTTPPPSPAAPPPAPQGPGDNNFK